MKTFQKFLEDKQPKTLILMRGISGSGKSTIARKLHDKLGGVIYSTDDFFTDDTGRYQFDFSKLVDYHEENKKRTARAMQDGISPIIIDNTNTQPWEMKDYVVLADKFGYEVMIKQPGDEGFDAVDLEEILTRQKNRSNIGKQIDDKVVQAMYDRFVPRVTLQDIRASEQPLKSHRNK